MDRWGYRDGDSPKAIEELEGVVDARIKKALMRSILLWRMEGRYA